MIDENYQCYELWICLINQGLKQTLPIIVDKQMHINF